MALDIKEVLELSTAMPGEVLLREGRPGRWVVEKNFLELKSPEPARTSFATVIAVKHWVFLSSAPHMQIRGLGPIIQVLNRISRRRTWEYATWTK